MSGRVVTLEAYEPGSDQWVEQRRRRVGGSEIAAILGIGKWESRFSLWHRKMGVLDPQADNPLMEWGRLLEPVIAARYAANHPEYDVVRAPSFTRTDRPWQLASPDRLLRNHLVIVEVKNARDADGWGEPGTDEVPVYYRAQVQWYMDTLDAERCDIAVLIAGSDYREYRVHYDQAEAEFMRREAEAFVATLESGERPRIDEHDATYQAVRALHPDIEPVSVELPADLARTYCTARHALKRAEAEAQWQKSLIADAMGSAQYATHAERVIARRQSKSGGRPYVVAADDLPTFTEEAA